MASRGWEIAMKRCHRCAAFLTNEATTCRACDAPQLPLDEGTCSPIPEPQRISDHRIEQLERLAYETFPLRLGRVAFRVGIHLVTIPLTLWLVAETVQGHLSIPELLGALFGACITEAVIRSTRLGLQAGVHLILIAA